MLSLGFSKAQLDIGYKPHWFSPLTDSSLLMSTEAPTMPSVSLSNYEPLTRLGLSYEFFEARMSKSDHIVWQNGYTTGYPRLGGIQLSMEPASGWSLGLNRLVQFGGGARGGGSLSALFNAIVNPSRYSNTNANLSVNQKATNQEASVTSSFLFPGRVPFAVYVEYAGEDTSRGRNYLLGNSALSWGIHFPRLGERFDLTLEASEWQNAWYVHSVCRTACPTTGWSSATGSATSACWVTAWAGAARSRASTGRLVRGQVQLRYRTLENQVYGVIPYQRYHEVSVGYSRPWKGIIIGGEFDSGSDAFGRSFGRLAGFVRYDNPNAQPVAALLDSQGVAGDADTSGQLFVDAGVNALRVRTDLTELTPKTTGRSMTGVHLALGARRAVSDHSDLGARLDPMTSVARVSPECG